MNLKKMYLAAVVTSLMGLAVTGCSADSDGSSQAEPSWTPERTIENPTRLSGAEFCAILSAEDVGPLTDGVVTDVPVPTNDRGLPGCKWPTRDGYGWFAVAVFKPYSVDALLSTSDVASIPVGSGTMHVQISVARWCSAFVQSPKSPDGFVLAVKFDAQSSGVAVNACTIAAPQVKKIVDAVGW